jgi:uncharacterized membrane protein
MTVFYYFLFLMLTWYFLIQIFRFSTYHKYFKTASIPLIGYGVLVGFLLFKFNLNSFFLWHVVLSTLLLYSNYSKQRKAAVIANSFIDESMKKQIELSMEKALRYHILSSVIFIMSFAAGFLFFYNN